MKTAKQKAFAKAFPHIVNQVPTHIAAMRETFKEALEIGCPAYRLIHLETGVVTYGLIANKLDNRYVVEKISKKEMLSQLNGNSVNPD